MLFLGKLEKKSTLNLQNVIPQPNMIHTFLKCITDTYIYVHAFIEVFANNTIHSRYLHLQAP